MFSNIFCRSIFDYWDTNFWEDIFLPLGNGNYKIPLMLNNERTTLSYEKYAVSFSFSGPE